MVHRQSIDAQPMSIDAQVTSTYTHNLPSSIFRDLCDKTLEAWLWCLYFVGKFYWWKESSENNGLNPSGYIGLVDMDIEH